MQKPKYAETEISMIRNCLNSVVHEIVFAAKQEKHFAAKQEKQSVRCKNKLFWSIHLDPE